jgi:uncharacterized protein involved in outer membrane biogenesis
MTEYAQGRQRKRRRLQLALAAVVVILLVLLAPPLVSVSRYKSQITRLMSSSLGRPVRLSSVEVRLLPRPGFVLTDLSVAEDPAYGAEPVLHANTVVASIRLLPLWRGRLEIGQISVDEASLNLVRTAPGRWNLDPIFRTAAAKAGSTDSSGGQRQGAPLPYLEATNSRINIKDGAEKLPFSLINTDLKFWQENPGDWRIRLRGQPARTDVSLDTEDTGVVRMEASARRAPELREMPVHVELDWREAQLGQLARLILGSDPGWRGDLTGELELDGTADAAQIRTRLRATGVHRAEFAPAEALDFDANCGFAYHYSRRALEKLVCNSPLGDGRIDVTGSWPDANQPPLLSIDLDRIPVAAGLAALRTLRSGVAPDLEAKGTVSGKIAYAATATAGGAQAKPARAGKRRPAKAAAVAQGPLTGTLTVDDFELGGNGLSQPVQAPRLVLEPVTAASAAQDQRQALAGTMALPAGGTTPLSINFMMALTGYQVTVRGQASLARTRELLHAAGMAEPAGLDALAGDPIAIDLSAEGPWLPANEIRPDDLPTEAALPAQAAATEARDSLSGTVTVRDANWKADFLANHVQITQATLHLGGGEIRWDPVTFSYGSMKGTASLVSPAICPGPEPCAAHFQVQLGNLDAATVETAILGVQEKGTLLSTLIDRLHPSSATPWPELVGTVTADSLALGPVTLQGVSADLKVVSTGVEIANLDGGLFGGSIHVAGSLLKPATDADKPAYTFEGGFQKLDVTSVGAMLGLRWAGAPLNGNGKIELSGYTAKDLAASTKGTLHFECRRGAIGNQPSESSKAGVVPAVLGRFDRWGADASIENGAVTLGQNEIQYGSRKRGVEGTVTFGEPPKVSLTAAKEAVAEKR